tara:strand:+ start:986 stop:1225 length:240 start_codon:yes stop_codon:yes gene_type:complete
MTIKRYEKESKVLEYLKKLGSSETPITIGTHKTICNPKLFSELHTVRIKSAITQKIYDNSLQEVGILKTELSKSINANN